MIIDEDVYLVHYGKKGMRWGNKSARTEKIEKARDYVKSRKYVDDRIKNTINYRRNREAFGRVAAYQIAKVEKNRINRELKTSMKAKNGKEFAAKIISAPLLITLPTALARSKAIRKIQN
jgi:hypothetical protein